MLKTNIVFKEENFLFATDIPVSVTYLNYANHLGHDSVLSLAQEARMQWLKKYNMTEIKIQNNIGYLITEAFVKYKSEAFYDDLLEIKIYLDNHNKKSFTLNYKITNKANQNVVALMTTCQLCYDYSAKKVTPIPAVLLELIYPSYLKKRSL